jgi:hypothetical protein
MPSPTANKLQLPPPVFPRSGAVLGNAPWARRHLPRAARLLQVGVGTSSLQSDMALLDGYVSIHSLDYSPVAIERLEAARAAAPAGPLRDALTYGVADMRKLEGHQDGEYGGALDKGALDALLCGDCGEADAAAALGEVRWLYLRGGARAAKGCTCCCAAPLCRASASSQSPPALPYRSGECWHLAGLT